MQIAKRMIRKLRRAAAGPGDRAAFEAYIRTEFKGHYPEGVTNPRTFLG